MVFRILMPREVRFENIRTHIMYMCNAALLLYILTSYIILLKLYQGNESHRIDLSLNIFYSEIRTCYIICETYANKGFEKKAGRLYKFISQYLFCPHDSSVAPHRPQRMNPPGHRTKPPPLEQTRQAGHAHY